MTGSDATPKKVDWSNVSRTVKTADRHIQF